jgi:hypothetical protein
MNVSDRWSRGQAKVQRMNELPINTLIKISRTTVPAWSRSLPSFDRFRRLALMLAAYDARFSN